MILLVHRLLVEVDGAANAKEILQVVSKILWTIDVWVLIHKVEVVPSLFLLFFKFLKSIAILSNGIIQSLQEENKKLKINVGQNLNGLRKVVSH
jgi:hypothetical protein